MNRSVARFGIVALIALFLGVATTAAAFTLIPDPGSDPGIFDDFNYSSTASGFWHVNAVGGSDHIKPSTLTLTGANIELDRRLQTDPFETVISVRIRAHSFKRFGVGIGIYHSGTVGMEFDDDGIKCGRGTDIGYKVDSVAQWKKSPVGKWFYLRMAVINPYPDPKVLAKLGNVDASQLKKVKIVCSAWDDRGHLIGTSIPSNPPPNAHYNALDEVYMRTWDSHNNYQVDWFYAGSPNGDPLYTMFHPYP